MSTVEIYRQQFVRVLRTQPKFSMDRAPQYYAPLSLAQVAKICIIETSILTARCRVPNGLPVFHQGGGPHAGILSVRQQKYEKPVARHQRS